jgi:type IX secretion system PorP/SprF family membrane protein
MKQQLITIFLIFNFIGTAQLLAQADISMATHWNNRANYNPAFIARTDYLYLFTNIRKQWVGVDGAPTVFNIQASDYVNSVRSAFGVSAMSDKVGVTQVLNPMLTYAYRIQLGKEKSFALGISGGAFYRSIDGTLFESETDNDPSVNYNLQSSIKPDVNLGFEMQTKHFIFGLSSTHLLSINRTDSLYLNTNHRYGYAIYKDNRPEIFNYSVGLQVVNRENLTVVELNGDIRFKEKASTYSSDPQELFDVGLTLRSTKQITLLLGINVTPNLRVGYAYDQNLFSGYYKNGTHEIMLEYRIPNSAAETYQCKYNGWYR